MLDSIYAEDRIETQWERIWAETTIEPSMQNLPHLRKVTCSAHFTVTQGGITLS